MADQDDHRLSDAYSALPESEQIMRAIRGVDPDGSGGGGLVDINRRCRSILRWQALPGVYMVSFERLIGPQGGGTRDAQIDELRTIAHHLGIRHTRRDLERIAGGLFGG